jgi:micrococcal nuclease
MRSFTSVVVGIAPNHSNDVFAGLRGLRAYLVRTLRPMSSRRAAIWILAFLALAVAGGGLRLAGGDEDGGDVGELAVGGRVVDVVDGDTVKVRMGDRTETVRYLGVDTPETVKPGTRVQCFGKQASEYNRRLVEGRAVRLRYSVERRDRYGRLLAYVYVDGSKRSVNADLIARGYGEELVIPPNVEHAERYRRLEQQARDRRLGLWGACR